MKLKEFKVLIMIKAEDEDEMREQVDKIENINEIEWWCEVGKWKYAVNANLEYQKMNGSYLKPVGNVEVKDIEKIKFGDDIYGKNNNRIKWCRYRKNS